MLISTLTGLIAGALHVVSGADHLVAIAPSSMGHPRSALKNGWAWGLGHSTGVLVLSLLAILIKDLAPLEKFSYFAELSVGIALLVVGALAIRTALGLSIHVHSHGHGDDEHTHLHLHLWGRAQHSRHHHAATSLGLLHGLAGASHLVAAIPALALPPLGGIAYLAAYLLGSMVAMSTVVLVISLATFRAGRKALPLIFGFTGGLSLVTGFFWIHRTSFNF